MWRRPTWCVTALITSSGRHKRTLPMPCGASVWVLPLRRCALPGCDFLNGLIRNGWGRVTLPKSASCSTITLRPRALQSRSRGGMALRFVGDLVSLRRWVSLGLARLTVAGVVTAATLLALAVLDPLLAAAMGVVLLTGAAA